MTFYESLIYILSIYNAENKINLNNNFVALLILNVFD